jgi:thioesterase domain-containing protein
LASLTLFDPATPDNSLSKRQLTQTEILDRYIEVIEMTAGHPLPIQQLDLKLVTFDEALQAIHTCLVEEGLISRLSAYNAIRGSVLTFARNLRTGYTPSRPYEAQLTLVLPANQEPQVNNNSVSKLAQQIKGWTDWAPRLTVHHSEGNHITMLRRPYVKSIVHAILRR